MNDGLHVNSNGTTVLAGNFISKIQLLCCNIDSNGGRLPKGNN